MMLVLILQVSIFTLIVAYIALVLLTDPLPLMALQAQALLEPSAVFRLMAVRQISLQPEAILNSLALQMQVVMAFQMQEH